MKKFIILPLLMSMLFLCVGCSQTLADKQQQENLVQLSASWQKIYSDLMGKEDDPATTEDESVPPKIPSRVVLESHGDLLKEATELELAKKESWQDQAQANKWGPK